MLHLAGEVTRRPENVLARDDVSGRRKRTDRWVGDRARYAKLNFEKAHARCAKLYQRTSVFFRAPLFRNKIRLINGRSRDNCLLAKTDAKLAL